MRWFGWIALLMLVPLIRVDDLTEMRLVIGRYSLYMWKPGYLLAVWMLWWSAWQR